MLLSLAPCLAALKLSFRLQKQVHDQQDPFHQSQQASQKLRRQPGVLSSC